MPEQIPFNDMPSNWRLPGSFIEISNLLAFTGAQTFKVLFIGQRLAAGTVAAGVATQVTRNEDADTYFGRGSMLAEMLRKGRAAYGQMDMWAIALEEDAAGAAATGTITLTGTATAAGTLACYIGGARVRAGVSAGDTETVAAAALVAAINADTSLPVTAAAVAGVVTLTCRWNGETGNDIDVRMNYYGESTPAGLATAIVDMSGGATNPDIATAIAAIGADWYNWIVMPFSDAANVVELETELNSLWGPTVQRGARAFGAYRGNHAAAITFGGTRNSPHVTWLPTNIAPQPPYLVAAMNAMSVANELSLDPARPLQALEIKGMMAPARDVRWDDTERNLLLYGGMATYTVADDGTCQVERQITSYQKNSAGVADASYLDINRPETIERIRYIQRTRIASLFIAGRFKLSGDPNARFAAGQPVATEDAIKAELFDIYRDLEQDYGWVDSFDAYKATIVIVIDTANGKVSWKDEPHLVGQARTFAGLMEFTI